MYPKSFEYISPKNIDDVISLLDKYKEDAKLIVNWITSELFALLKKSLLNIEMQVFFVLFSFL